MRIANQICLNYLSYVSNSKSFFKGDPPTALNFESSPQLYNSL